MWWRVRFSVTFALMRIFSSSDNGTPAGAECP